MANPKNTNNSLSDLNNQGQGFNKSLSLEANGDNGVNNITVSQQDAVKGQISELRKKRSSAKNKLEREGFDKQLSSKNDELTALDTLTENELADMTSLFDSNALIDYARYIETDGTVTKDWKHYNSELNGDKMSFKNNSSITKRNQPVPYKDTTLDSDEGLSLPNLIEWSEKYPALQLKFQDFAYCKKLGYYPNNRLIVLRRFKAGVPDNLFDYVNTGSRVEFNQPLSTMITWWNPEEEIGSMDFKFNENWTGYSKGLMDTFKTSISDFTGGLIGGEDDKGKKKTGAVDLINGLIGEKLLSEGYKKEDGVPYTRSSVGSPNLINDAMVRKTGGEGLSSNIGFSLKFEYEMRDINGIDPGIAMIDLISNCTRMGTSVSEFRYNIPALKESVGVKALINGDIGKALDTFKEALKDFTTDISKLFEKVGEGIQRIAESLTTGIFDTIKNSAEYIISRYREDLKAALSVDTGLPSGVWHVTIGNPKSPIISCGDLVIDSSTLKLGKELGYNDFPNEFSVTYSLKSARPRGRDELNRIFNAGRGRVYVYENAKLNPDYDLYSSDTSKSKK
jgi:hypothetical protein